ncbi:hypothetical protein QBC46DRAFT_75957 [Diplogelasinospora grovesii]|uniref:Uncharacterized protein n=1 Tax=Diplogelasinospora grovesii TaxID=303347 RepID=A0AAN6MX67_9PEZI|nr:hypothetical protein QBC46DRAFT_75957 [Diplogelasinospora grovesii]
MGNHTSRQRRSTEKSVDLPPALVMPWEYLQRRFGLSSQSGNNMSNIVLNHDEHGRHIFKINAGLSDSVLRSEEAFSGIFYNCERLGLSIYYHVVLSVICFERRDAPACAAQVAAITAQLGPLLRQYYGALHDGVVKRSEWLSHVQGFFGWGVGHLDQNGDWIKYDGLSGNQALVFMVLDAFLGIEPYLSALNQERNVPARQRALCRALERNSFRGRLTKEMKEE